MITNETNRNKDIPEMLTVKEVLKILKISRTTLYRMIEKGELKVYRFGRSIRVKQDDLRAFIEEHVEQG